MGPASESPSLPGETKGVYRDGKLLVVPTAGVSFPDRCVRCNAPAEGYRLRKTLRWHPTGVHYLVLFGVVGYVVALLRDRESVPVEMGLCPAHRRRRKRGQVLTLVALSLLVAVSAAVLWGDPGRFALALNLVWAVLVLAAVLGGLTLRTAAAKRIADGQAWLRVGRAFRDSFSSEKSSAKLWKPGESGPPTAWTS